MEEPPPPPPRGPLVPSVHSTLSRVEGFGVHSICGIHLPVVLGTGAEENGGVAIAEQPLAAPPSRVALGPLNTNPLNTSLSENTEPHMVRDPDRGQPESGTEDTERGTRRESRDKRVYARALWTPQVTL